MTQISSQRDTLSQVKIKRFVSTARQRVNSQREAAKFNRIVANHQRRFGTQMRTVARRFNKVQAFIYGETGVYDYQAAGVALRDELLPVLRAQQERVAKSVLSFARENYRNRSDQKGLLANYSIGDRDAFLLDSFLMYRQRDLILANTSFNIAFDLRNKISRMVEAGDSQRDVRKMISAQGFPRNRAEMIARTEMHIAANTAHHKIHTNLAAETGEKFFKKWVNSGDQRVRDIHSNVDPNPVAMDETFSIAGDQLEHAGDPNASAKNVINCRCTVVYVNEDDVVDGSKPDPTPEAALPPIDPNREYVNLDGARPNSLTGSAKILAMARASTAKDLRDKVNSKLAANQKLWGEIDLESSQAKRFRGRTGKGGTIAHTPAALKKLGYNDLEIKMFYATIDDALDTTNAIAKKFGVPPLRKIVAIPRNGRASMNMGDGVLGINAGYNLRFFRKPKHRRRQFREGGDTYHEMEYIPLTDDDMDLGGFFETDASIALAKGKTHQGDFTRKMYKDWFDDNATYAVLTDGSIDKSSISGIHIDKAQKFLRENMPFSADYYLDDGIDRFLSSFYHEFGHNVHQQYGLDFTSLAAWRASHRGVQRLVSTPMEDLIDDLAGNIASRLTPSTLGTSTYGMTEPVEWFTENFSLWCVGRDDLCSPEFLDFIDDILAESDSFRRIGVYRT